MPNIDAFEVRDLRTKEKFVVDDEYLNGWAKYCGIYATGVYVVLCRHVNGETQSCFPSIPTIAEKLGISQRQVIRAITILKKFNIIATGKGKDHNANVYYLIDKKYWLTGDSQSLVTNSHGTSDCESFLLVTDSHPKVLKRRKQKKDICSADFESFYAAYPKKRARGAAEKAWQRIRPDETLLSSMLDKLELLKSSEDWKKEGGKYIPYPATWLNDRRWEDEIPEVKPQKREVAY